MTDRNVTHGTFVVQRSYPVSTARAFKAWADPALKARWFMGGTTPDKYALDFRIGGKESNRIELPGGQVITYAAMFQNIVADNRIVYSYDMHDGDQHTSASLTTVEFKPEGQGTRLVLTEQGAFFDGFDSPKEREEGNNFLLGALAEMLQAE